MNSKIHWSYLTKTKNFVNFIIYKLKIKDLENIEMKKSDDFSQKLNINLQLKTINIIYLYIFI